MKYRIVGPSNNEFEVVVEDGGISSIRKTENGYETTYYQDKIDTETMNDNNLFVVLGEGKAYHKDWPKHTDKDEMIQDALDWLANPSPNKWTKTDELFKNLFQESL